MKKNNRNISANGRNNGIDLLRIVAMIMVVILHFYNLGGIFDYSEMGSAHHNTSLAVIIVTFAGVDIFAIISGYVSACSDRQGLDISRYVKLWMTVVFYGLVLSFMFDFCFYGINDINDYMRALLPVTYNEYWYFTTFTGLFVLKPLLDRGLSKCSEDLLKKFFVVILIAFSFYSIFFDVFELNSGYSLIWLLLLYIIGYSMKKSEIFKNARTWILLIVMICLYIFTFMFYNLTEEFSNKLFTIEKLMFVNYTSPTILISAIIMVTIFSRIKLNDGVSELLKILAPTAFSIYLVDCHPRMVDIYHKGYFWGLIDGNVWYVLFVLVGLSIILSVAVMLFDLIRIKLFEICGLNKLADKVEKVLRIVLEKVVSVI